MYRAGDRHLNICNFTVHLLLKPGLENFEHYFTSVRNECNCVEAALSLENRLGLKNDDEEKGITWLTVSKDKNGPFEAKQGNRFD